LWKAKRTAGLAMMQITYTEGGGIQGKKGTTKKDSIRLLPENVNVEPSPGSLKGS